MPQPPVDAPDFAQAARACLDGQAPIAYGIVLGSGLAVLEDLDRDPARHAVCPDPWLSPTTVEGHKGVISIGRVPSGARVAIARGRFSISVH